MTSPDTRLVKVVVPTEDGGTERLWAAPQGSGRYRLDNLLFVAFGLSLGLLCLNLHPFEFILRFEDSLEIGRQTRTQMYVLNLEPETPGFLAPRLQQPTHKRVCKPWC